jgi:hypothetical protein
MSTSESPKIDQIYTPNIFSPLDSPSLMNSTIDGDNLTQSIIEHKKIVEALEKAILESNQEPESNLADCNIENLPVTNDGKLLEFLKENREVIEPIIKEKYVEIVNILEEDRKLAEPIENREEPVELIESKDPESIEKKSNRLFIFGSVLLTGLVGYFTYSYFKKKD